MYRMEQKETSKEEIPLTVSFIVPNYNYLPDNGAPIRLNTSEGMSELNFVTALDQVPFTVKAAAISGDLVKLSLQAGKETFFNRWFAKDELRELTIAGAHFEIKVQHVDKDKSATITVRRL